MTFLHTPPHSSGETKTGTGLDINSLVVLQMCTLPPGVPCGCLLQKESAM